MINKQKKGGDKLGKFYDKKVIRSGNIIEVFEYERLIKIGEVRNKNGRRFEASEEDKIKNRRQAMYRARSQVRRLINANVDAWGQKAKFLTLTFAEHITDIRQANYEFKKFRQRLEYDIGLKLKYVAVIEFQKTGRIHYHVIFFNLPYIESNYLASIWANGFIKINAIEHVDNVGAYITKYMTKDNEDERLKGQKSYFTSRGLKKPVEEYIDEKEIANIKKELSQKKVYESKFENEYTGNIIYTQYNLNRQ